jgi:uncharacterized protein (DUF4415 family)
MSLGRKLTDGNSGVSGQITLKLDNVVLAAFTARAGGRGYQALVNETLRAAMRGVQLANLVRNVIRVKLHSA